MQGRKKTIYKGIQRLSSTNIVNTNVNQLLIIVFYEDSQENWLVEDGYQNELFRFYREQHGIDVKRWLRMPVYAFKKVE